MAAMIKARLRTPMLLKAVADKSTMNRAETGYWDHRDPHSHVDLLWPSLPAMERIELTPVPLKTSADFVGELERDGMQFQRLRLAMRSYAGGFVNLKTRKLDNSDVFRGKPQIYGDSVNDAKQVYLAFRNAVRELTSLMKSKADDDVVAQAELNILKKECYQQWKYPAWFLNRPISDVKVPTPSAYVRARFFRYAKRMAKVLKEKEPKLWSANIQDLIRMDYDPSDTNVGSPTFQAGDMTLEARLATVKAMPVPWRLSPSQFNDAMFALGQQLGLPPNVIFDSFVSTRKGASDKSFPLWYWTGAGFGHNFTAKGAYCRVRNVFPAAWWANLLLSAVYVLMKHARMNTPGLYHLPENQERDSAKLAAQGSHPLALDFSGMDLAIQGDYVDLMFEALEAAGFPKWVCQWFRDYYRRSGVLFPDFYGELGYVMRAFGKVIPWPSGVKFTSEGDTFYGAVVLLTTLEQFIPDIWDRWERGDWIFRELGDDIIFTLNDADYARIDVEKMKDFARDNFGATLKVEKDIIFLMKLQLRLLKGYRIPKKNVSQCGLGARILQQTFANEESYTGVEGGDKPDAILRLGLRDKLKDFTCHPYFHEMWPIMLKALMEVGYVKRADSRFIETLKAGEPVLSAEDEAAILEYGTKVPSFLADLKYESQFRASAASLLAAVEEIGCKPDDAAVAAILFRGKCVDALGIPAAPADILNLKKLCPPHFAA